LLVELLSQCQLLCRRWLLPLPLLVLLLLAHLPQELHLLLKYQLNRLCLLPLLARLQLQLPQPWNPALGRD
jgi:hypothetical protein